MSLASQVSLFVKRRLDVPVRDDALVLDVGSGDKPSWRADVLLDRYLGAEYAGQRSGTGAAKVSRPLFNADAADMPFGDQVFDYSICSHLLEHVPDPGGVIEELMRVSKAGYIEVPEAASCRIVDFPSHVWLIRLDESTTPATLVFEPKHARWNDPELAAYFARSGLADKVERVLNTKFEDRVIMLPWEGTINYRIEAPVDAEFMRAVLDLPGHTKTLRSRMVRAATQVWTRTEQRRILARRIRWDEVVKPALRRGDDLVLVPGVYDV